MNFGPKKVFKGHFGLFSHSDRLSKPLHQRVINHSWIEMGVSPAIIRWNFKAHVFIPKIWQNLSLPLN